MPKVIQMLESTCHYLPQIYPKLLPLLAKIPSESLQDSCPDLLQAIKKGVKTFVVSTAAVTNRRPGKCQAGGYVCIETFFEVAFFMLLRLDYGQDTFENIINQVSYEPYRS